ncbi:U1 [Hyposoter didymator ichnovirus]|nr:U1 [Hyposoter didymator ichnovirus]
MLPSGRQSQRRDSTVGVSGPIPAFSINRTSKLSVNLYFLLHRNTTSASIAAVISFSSARCTACSHGSTVPAAARALSNHSPIRLLTETRSGAVLSLGAGMIKEQKNSLGCMLANASTCISVCRNSLSMTSHNLTTRRTLNASH